MSLFKVKLLLLLLRSKARTRLTMRITMKLPHTFPLPTNSPPYHGCAISELQTISKSVVLLKTRMTSSIGLRTVEERSLNAQVPLRQASKDMVSSVTVVYN